jgi:signal transduction histidine kinase
MNLISNAIKYTPPGGRIDVSLRTSGPELITTVEDTGIGIAEEDLPHIFAEFFRTGRAKATGEIGTGLGLSIVKHLVDAYQGGIQVQSKPGRGTRFTVRLPLQPARGGAAEEEDRESVPVSTNAASQPNPKAPYPPSFVLDGGLEARRQG